MKTVDLTVNTIRTDIILIKTTHKKKLKYALIEIYGHVLNTYSNILDTYDQYYRCITVIT